MCGGFSDFWVPPGAAVNIAFFPPILLVKLGGGTRVRKGLHKPRSIR